MKFGLPKNKNLKTMVNELFAQADIYLESASARVDFAAMTGSCFEGVACNLKQKTLAQWVAEGRLDGGVVGYDYALEFNERASAEGRPQVEVLEFLDIARCDLKIAVPEAMPFRNIRALNGQRIATSYTAILAAFLKAQNVVPQEIVEMEGSVEMAVALGQADAIFDVVETGNSLRANRLKPVFTVLSSQATLIIPEKSVRARMNTDMDSVMVLAQQLKKPRAMPLVNAC